MLQCECFVDSMIAGVKSYVVSENCSNIIERGLLRFRESVLKKLKINQRIFNF